MNYERRFFILGVAAGVCTTIIVPILREDDLSQHEQPGTVSLQIKSVLLTHKYSSLIPVHSHWDTSKDSLSLSSKSSRKAIPSYVGDIKAGLELQSIGKVKGIIDQKLYRSYKDPYFYLFNHSIFSLLYLNKLELYHDPPGMNQLLINASHIKEIPYLTTTLA